MTTIRLEAHLMQARTGLKASAWEQWFLHIGVTSIIELKTRYPGAEHAECMAHAVEELETFVFGFKPEWMPVELHT
jgi:hypothetical protein